MVGYLPSSCFVFLWSQGPPTQKKKEHGQYPAMLTKKAWSIKDLLFDFKAKFCHGTRRVVLSGEDSFILLAQVTNHNMNLVHLAHIQS